MKPFKSKLRLAVSALIFVTAVVAVACLTTGCSDSSEELANQIKAKEAEISKLQADQNQLVGMYNQLQSNQVASQPPNYQQEGAYQPSVAPPAPVVIQSPQSNSDGALMGGVAGFMLGQAISNSGGNNGNGGYNGGGYNSNSRTVINRTIINQPARPISSPSTARLPTTISKPSLPTSKPAPISKPSTFTRSISPRSSYSFTRRR